MKYNHLFASVFCFVLIALSSNAFAQHWLQLDDGIGHYLLIRPAAVQTGSFTFSLPVVSSNQTILTQGATSTYSTALLWNGNTNGTGAPDPAIAGYGKFGTQDAVALQAMTSNTTRMTIAAAGNGDVTFTGNLTPAVTGASDLGTNALRWGRLKLALSLDNTQDNPIASDAQGIGSNGLNWKISGTGFVANFMNEENASPSRDGIQIALATSDGASRAIAVTTGTAFNPPGGPATFRPEVFRVMNDGSTFNAGGTVHGYAEVASGTSPASVTSTIYLLLNTNGPGGASDAVKATITLPAGAPNGTLVVLTTNDPDGAQELGTTFSFSRASSGRFVKTSDGWKAEF